MSSSVHVDSLSRLYFPGFCTSHPTVEVSNLNHSDNHSSRSEQVILGRVHDPPTMVFDFSPSAWRPSVLVFPRRFYSRYVVYAVAFCLAFWTLHHLRYKDPLRLGAPTIERPWKAPSEWSHRASQVRSSFLHAYHGYEMYAAPLDELKPLSNGSLNTYSSISSH